MDGIFRPAHPRPLTKKIEHEDFQDTLGLMIRYYPGFAHMGGDLAIEYKTHDGQTKTIRFECVVDDPTSTVKFIGATTCPDGLRPRGHQGLDSADNDILDAGQKWHHAGSYRQGSEGGHVAVAWVGKTPPGDVVKFELTMTVVARDPWTADYVYPTIVELD